MITIIAIFVAILLLCTFGLGFCSGALSEMREERKIIDAWKETISKWGNTIDFAKELAMAIEQLTKKDKEDENIH